MISADQPSARGDDASRGRSAARRAADQIATLSLGLVAIATAVFAYSLTPLFVMATDNCPADCDISAVRLGVAVTWIGTAVVLTAMLLGIVWSRRRGRMGFVWPLLAIPVIVGLLLIGAGIAASAASQ